jgi:general secretion pathway protein B
MPAASRRRGMPVWVWVLVGLLCVNMGVLLVLLLRGGSAGSPHAALSAGTPASGEPPARTLHARNLPAAPDAQGTSETPASGTAQSPHAPDHFSPLDNQPVYAPEIPVQEDSAGVSAAPPGGASVAARAESAPAHAARRSDPVLNDEPPEDGETLPTISELNLTGNQSLPDIHLDVHVYASRPADRFVYVNMRKYREGAVLQEGPTLERIRRDGVVLNYNGLRFLVPRQ